MRAFKSTSQYPAYKHTSFNLEWHGSTTVRVSLHFKYNYANGGFWFGVRPEFEVHRGDDKLRALVDKMQQAQRECVCHRCGVKAWGEPGMRLPDGWEFIGLMEFCDTCTHMFSAHELLHPERVMT